MAGGTCDGKFSLLDVPHDAIRLITSHLFHAPDDACARRSAAGLSNLALTCRTLRAIVADVRLRDSMATGGAVSQRRIAPAEHAALSISDVERVIQSGVELETLDLRLPMPGLMPVLRPGIASGIVRLLARNGEAKKRIPIAHWALSDLSLTDYALFAAFSNLSHPFEAAGDAATFEEDVADVMLRKESPFWSAVEADIRARAAIVGSFMAPPALGIGRLLDPLQGLSYLTLDHMKLSASATRGLATFGFLTRLVGLQLTSMSHFDMSLFAHTLPHCTRLRALDFSYTLIGGYVLRKSISMLDTLVSLRLAACIDGTATCALQFVLAFVNLTRLTELDISHNSMRFLDADAADQDNGESTSITVLNRHLVHTSSLASLNLSHVNLSGFRLFTLIGGIDMVNRPAFRELRELVMQNCNLEMFSLPALTHCLDACSDTLMRLDLSNNALMSVTLEFLAPLLSTCTRLTALLLRNVCACNVLHDGDHSFGAAYHAFDQQQQQPRQNRLQQLQRSQEYSTDGFEKVCSAVGSLPNLVTLDLSNNVACGDQWMIKLAASLTACTQLRVLNLGRNFFVDAQMPTLLAAMPHTLRALFIRNPMSIVRRSILVAKYLQVRPPATQQPHIARWLHPDYQLGDRTASALTALLKRTPELRELDVADHDFGPLLAEGLACAIPGLPELHLLDVSGNRLCGGPHPNENQTFLSSESDAGPEGDSSNRFSVAPADMPVAVDGFVRMCTGLASRPWMRSLFINGVNLTVNGRQKAPLLALSKALSSMTRLSCLSLSQTGLLGVWWRPTGVTFEPVSPPRRRRRRSETALSCTVHTSATGVIQGGPFARLCAALNGLRNLHVLDLSANPLTHESVANLCISLRYMKALCAINFSALQLSKKTMLAMLIPTLCECCPALRVLDIGTSNVERIPAPLFCQTPPHLLIVGLENPAPSEGSDDIGPMMDHTETPLGIHVIPEDALHSYTQVAAAAAMEPSVAAAITAFSGQPFQGVGVGIAVLDRSDRIMRLENEIIAASIDTTTRRVRTSTLIDSCRVALQELPTGNVSAGMGHWSLRKAAHVPGEAPLQQVPFSLSQLGESHGDPAASIIMSRLACLENVITYAHSTTLRTVAHHMQSHRGRMLSSVGRTTIVATPASEYDFMREMRALHPVQRQ